MILASATVALAAILGGLPQQLCLQREDVIKDPIDAPPFEAMVGDHAGAFEMAAKGGSERAIDAGPASNLGFFQELQAAVERKLAEPVLPNRHLLSVLRPRSAACFAASAAGAKKRVAQLGAHR